MSSFLTPRLDSFNSRQDVFGNIETLFNDVFDGMLSKKTNLVKGNPGYPRMDMFEVDNQFYIQLACAGLTDKDIDISLSNECDLFGINSKSVTITGDKLEAHDKADFHLKGLTRSSFSKTIRLPENLTGDPIATMENGLLTLKWNFAEPEKLKTAKKIQINKTFG